MVYDIVGCEHRYGDNYSFYTIGNLIDLCLSHPEKTFRFVGTNYTVGYLHSWRGRYALAAISYEDAQKTGKQIAKELTEALKEVHRGWKGGEYRYAHSDQFYISEEGRCSEHKVIGYEVEDNEVILLTKLDPY